MYPDSRIQGSWTYQELRKLGEGPVEIPANGDMAGKLRKVPIAEWAEHNRCEPDPLTYEDERILAEIWDDRARQEEERLCRATVRARKKRMEGSGQLCGSEPRLQQGFPPACIECNHWIMRRPVADTCRAFPTGIPDEILLYGNPHTEAVVGDGGVRFERRPRLRDKYAAT